MLAAVLAPFLPVLLPAGATQGKTELVSFRRRDETTIHGLLQKPPDAAGKPAVVCLPMYNHFKGDYRQLLAGFSMSGIVALAIDPRGHGASVKRPGGEDLAKRVRARETKIFLEMREDVDAAVEYLVQTVKVDPSKVGVLGASVGGSVAVHAAAENPKIAAVAWLTPGESYLGMPTMEHLKKLGERPLLLATAQDEEGKGTNQLLETMQGRKVEKQVFPVSEAHGTNLFHKDGNVLPFLATWFSQRLSATPPQAGPN